MDEKDVFDKLFDQAPQKLETVKQVNEFHRIITKFIRITQGLWDSVNM